MTPLKIEILLHYYYSPTDYRDNDFSAPAVREAIDEFREVSGLLVEIEEPDRYYGLTERGEAYVNALCDMPLPECVWTIPEKQD